ncbi:MAG: YcaO-like family protein [Haloarculaceae archaeon]
MPTVTVVGSGPAAEAVVAGVGDAGATVERDREDLDGADLGIVVDRSGADTFRAISDSARAAGVPWIAVELGGIGGYPIVDAAVAAFGVEGACYRCLAGRVEANVAPETDPVEAPGAATQRFAGAVAARLAGRHLEDGEDVFGQVIEAPYRERSLLPLPGCACGGGRDPELGRKYDAVDVDRAVSRAEHALDERVGIVTQVGEGESFPAPYYLAQLCDTGSFSDATAPRQAAGVAADWDRALMRALGESLERYAAGVYTAADTERAPAEGVENPVEPTAFVAPESDYAPGDTVEWMAGEDLQTGGRASVPADLVFHPPREERFRPAVTTGLGLGSSGAGALLSGLYEVIERDAAMLSWYSTYEPLALAVEDEGFETLAARAGAEGLSVTPLLLTQDVDVPVVAVAVERDEWPRLALGSAANFDPQRAARKALAEALQNWMELRSMGPEGAADAGGAIGEYAADPGPVADWVDADQRIPAESVGPDPAYAGEDALAALIDRLDEAGLAAYAARTTTRDLEALGFEAVRVLVPEAQPLFLDDPFFGERADRVPRDLGFEPRPDRAFHPFP